MKHTKKILALALAATMIFGSFAMAFAAEVTVPADVYDAGPAQLPTAVEKLMEAGAITGDVDGLFHPNDPLTRAQICKMLVTLVNPPATELTGTVTVNTPASGFTDLKGYGWASDYINYASNNSIAKGYAGNVFKPGSDVTFAELVTFTVRAAGYTDEEIGGTWPENFLKKGDELGLYDHLGMVDVNGNGPAENVAAMQKAKATKWQAALVLYNAMDEIAEANEREDLPQGTDKDNAPQTPDFAGFVFADESFDSDMTTYAGKTLAKDVKVYVYDVEKNYKKDMELSTRTSEYRESNVYKYKSVATPAWYKLEGGKITEMIVPGDVGFSGKIYCVINSTTSRVLNYEDKSVVGIETLTAGREITWFGQDGFTLSVPGTPDGAIYELVARDGEVRGATKIGSSGFSGKKFAEITSNGFETVADRDDNLVNITGKGWHQVKDNAAVYVINDDNDYEAGSISSIRTGYEVRLYDISDDDENAADIVVVKKI